jgi:hypothetical protein
MATTDPVEDISESSDEREGEDKDRFAKTLGSVVGRRLTYDGLTGKNASV